MHWYYVETPYGRRWSHRWSTPRKYVTYSRAIREDARFGEDHELISWHSNKKAADRELEALRRVNRNSPGTWDVILQLKVNGRRQVR